MRASKWQLIMSKSIREQYNIPQQAKILLYVGNISENKNQIQMVEAFDLLPDELRINTWVLFCGENHMGDDESFKDAIKISRSASHLIVCGGIKKEIIPAYYQDADAVVLLSKSEGFGLSLIEGMYFGKPCLMFTDMDAYENIYNECAVIGVTDRNNQSVAKGIGKLLTNEWNLKTIKKYSEKFGKETMARNYLKNYKLLIN